MTKAAFEAEDHKKFTKVDSQGYFGKTVTSQAGRIVEVEYHRYSEHVIGTPRSGVALRVYDSEGTLLPKLGVRLTIEEATKLRNYLTEIVGREN